MHARAVSFGQKATISVFFVLLFLALPNNAKFFPNLRAFETRSDELGNNDNLTENKESVKIDDSIDNTESSTYCFRLRRRGKTPIRLETVVARFQGDFTGSDGTTRSASIDLIGAIHFADQSYYDELNRIFREYDVVVFEMVTPAGVDVDKLIREEREEQTSDQVSLLNVVPFVQKTLADALDFSYQIEGVDYGASNLKQGDATVEEFLAKLLSNVDVADFSSSYLFSALLDESRGDIEGKIRALLCAKSKRLTARRLLALDLENSNEDKFISDDLDETTRATSPDDDALIAFRNQKALKVVRRELEKGRVKIAIFYGAAHLPDFAQRLKADFGMERTPETRWIPAWNMEKE